MYVVTPPSSGYILTLYRARREMQALVEKFPDGLQDEGMGVKKEYHDQSNATKHSGELELDPEIIAGNMQR